LGAGLGIGVEEEKHGITEVMIKNKRWFILPLLGVIILGFLVAERQKNNPYELNGMRLGESVEKILSGSHDFNQKNLRQYGNLITPIRIDSMRMMDSNRKKQFISVSGDNEDISQAKVNVINISYAYNDNNLFLQEKNDSEKALQEKWGTPNFEKTPNKKTFTWIDYGQKVIAKLEVSISGDGIPSLKFEVRELGIPEFTHIYFSTNNKNFNAITIEGEIKQGDYEAFENLIKRQSGKITDVLLMSPGGNATEAMKIGNLIRTLKLRTNAPMGYARPLCIIEKPFNAENCTCESACFLIFVAGIERNGTIIGIHRVYVRHDLLKNLPEEQAVKAAADIKNNVASYFNTMGVPSHYLDRSFSTPSDKMDFLSEVEIDRDFSGFLPEYQEWVTAKCGNRLQLYDDDKKIYERSKYKKLAKTIGDLRRLDKDYNAVMALEDKNFKCEKQLVESIVMEAFNKNYAQITN
jgi:hypothetical protein